MPEPLTIPLGIIIAKAVVKVWLGDEFKILTTTADTLADIAARVVPDWQAKSALRRQLEKVSEKSAASLEPLIENEFDGLGVGEKKQQSTKLGKRSKIQVLI